MEGPITSQSAIINSAGRAVCTAGPERYGEQWRVTRMVTNITPITAGVNTRLDVYRNSETPSQMVDGTYTAEQNVSETDIGLRSGEKLVFVWSGGTPNSIATIILTGETGRGIS